VFYGEEVGRGGFYHSMQQNLATTWLIALITALNCSARSFLVGSSNIKTKLALPPKNIPSYNSQRSDLTDTAVLNHGLFKSLCYYHFWGDCTVKARNM